MWLRLRASKNFLLGGGRFYENTTAAVGVDTSRIRFRTCSAVVHRGESAGRSAAGSASPATGSAGRSGSSGTRGAAEFRARCGFVSAGGRRRLGHGSVESPHGDRRQPVGG